MRRFSNFQAIPLSFFSRDLYRDAGQAWKGVGLLFQLLLVVLATAVLTVRIHFAMASFESEEVASIVAQIPAITIVHGRVLVDAPMPYTIREPKTGKAIAILDTSGQVGSLANTEALALLTRDHVFIKRRANLTEVYDLRSIERLHIDRDRVAGWVHLFARWAALLCAPFVLAGLYAWRLVVLVVCAAAALVGLRVARRPGDFAGAMRLASVALAPATLLEILLDGVGVKPRAFGFAWLVIVVGYLMFAVQSIQRASPEPRLEPAAEPGVSEHPRSGSEDPSSPTP